MVHKLLQLVLIMLLCVHAEMSLEECGRSLEECCSTDPSKCLEYCSADVTKYSCWSRLVAYCSESPGDINKCTNDLEGNTVLVDTVIQFCETSSACMDFCVQYPDFCMSLCDAEPSLCGNVMKTHAEDIMNVCNEHPEDCIGLCENHEGTCVNFCAENSETCVNICAQNLGNCTQFIESHPQFIDDHPQLVEKICTNDGVICNAFCGEYPESCFNFCETNPVHCVDMCNANQTACENLVDKARFCETIAGACSASCGDAGCTFNFLYDSYAESGGSINVTKQLVLVRNIDVNFSSLTIKGSDGPHKRVLVDSYTINYPATEAGAFTLENLQLIRSNSSQQPMLIVGKNTALTSATLQLINVDVLYDYDVGQMALPPISIQVAGFNITNTIFKRGSQLSTGTTERKRMANVDDCVRTPINPAVQLEGSIGTFTNVSFENFNSGTLRVNGGQVTFDGVSFSGNKLTTFAAGYDHLRHNAYFQNVKVMVKGQGVTSDVQTGTVPNNIPNLFFSVSLTDETTGFFDGSGGILKSTDYSLLYAASLTTGAVEGEGNERRISFVGDFVPCTYTVGVYRPQQVQGTPPTQVPLQVLTNVSASIPFSTTEFTHGGNYTFDVNYQVGGGRNAWAWASAPPLLSVAVDAPVTPRGDVDNTEPKTKLTGVLLMVVIVVPAVVFILAVVVVIIVVVYFKKKNTSDSVNVSNFDLHEDDKPATDASAGAIPAGTAGTAQSGGSKHSSKSSTTPSHSSDSSSLSGSDRRTRSRSSGSSSAKHEQMRHNDMYAGNSIEENRPPPFDVGSDHFNPRAEEDIKAPYRDVDDHDSYTD